MGFKNLTFRLAMGLGTVVLVGAAVQAQTGTTAAYQNSANNVYYQTSSPTTTAPILTGNAIAGTTHAAPAVTQSQLGSVIETPNVSYGDVGGSVVSDCGCSGAAPVAQYAPAGDACGCATPSCQTGGCSTGGCQLGSRLGGCGLGNRLEARGALGDQWTLFGNQCDEPRIKLGGWFQGGYHSEDNGLFNSRPDELNLHQAWFFAEKEAKSVNGGLGFGFRFDGMYGQDGPDTQAFGNPGNSWDLGPNFQRGAQYGWAIPQLYGEVAMGDWNVKVGHFFTLIGYEVVTAPDNFFYSHAMTMYNSEPFTHTGALASYDAGNDTTIYAGWTAGWDTGFDQFGNGSNFLGGISTGLGEYSTMTYMTTFGDFGARGADAYSHSFVFDTTLTENLTWIAQSDLLRVDSTGEDNVGLNNYLLYNVNERLGIGTRMEWWKGDSLTGYAPHGGVLPASGSHSYYGWTTGLNIRTSANVVIRPEYRYDWSPALGYEQGYFGIDMIALY